MSPRLLASLALLILVAPRPARACLCTPPPTGQAGLARSIAVFEGTVLSLAQESFYTRARVKVMRRWKGPDVAELDVRTGGTGGACGHSFQAGQTWLFYTQADCNLFVSSICTGSKQIADATADLADLGSPLPAGAELPDGGTYDGGRLNDAGVCAPDMTAPPDMAGPKQGCSVGERAPTGTALPLVALLLFAVAASLSRGLRASGSARRPRR